MRSRKDGLWLVGLLALIAVLMFLGREAPPAEVVASPTATPVETPLQPSPPPDAICGPPSKTLRTLVGVKSPELTQKVRVRFETDLGPLDLEVFPQAAPNGAKRFLDLVQAGFYDDTPIFRVVPGFVCQFGLNSKFAQSELTQSLPDEPSLFCLERGTIAFAKSSAPNSANTQVFINYDNTTASLIPEPGGNGGGIFTAFGKVVSGMEIADKFRPVGDPQMGLDQSELTRDTQGYLKSLTEKPHMIRRARVIP